VGRAFRFYSSLGGVCWDAGDFASRARAIVGWAVQSTGAGTLTGLGRRFGRDVSTVGRRVVEIEKQAAEANIQGWVLRK
jgi:hypothetical protein